MFNIKELLSRYHFEPSERMQRDAAAKVIQDVTGISIASTALKIHGTTLYVNARPAQRSEILLARVALLEGLRAHPLTQAIRMIH